jgi:succinate dehydrogenase cytochrome b556 subunit/succinate dehydrogenase hydrophobic membrane anchor protein
MLMAGMTLQRPTAQRSNGLDLFSWYFLRVSGVALVFLALTHIFITHYLNVPSETTTNFVLGRWQNPLWRTFDWLLLMASLIHGLIGLRLSVDDYLHRPGLRVLAQSIVWVLGFLFIGLGSITIFTLDIDRAPDGTLSIPPGVLNDQKWIATMIEFSLVLVAIITYIAVVAFIVWVISIIARGGAPIYWGDPGQYAWVMHRATGIGVLFFLLVHIIDIALIGLGRDLYDQTVEFYATPFLIPMEIMLVGAVIYHSLNGIRILLIDFWKPGGVRLERPLYYATLGLTIVLTIPSGIIILNHALGG